MAVYATPGLYYETVSAGGPRVPGVRMDIAGLVGCAAKGPLDTVVPVTSWEQFQATFGTFLPGPFLAYTVKAFFENGGRECRIVRVAAPPASTALDVGSPQPADRSYTVVVDPTGFAPGAVVTATQGAVRKDQLLADVDSVARKLVWSRPLDPAFLSGLGIHFETGPSAADALLADGAGLATIRVTAASAGTWGDALTVLVQQTNSAATATKAGIVQPADRASSIVSSLARIATGSLIRVFQDQSPFPVEHYHTVTSTDASRNRIVWDTPLEPAYNLAQAISFETLEFTLSVHEKGILREVFEGVSLVPQHASYINNLQSRYIVAADAFSPSPFPARLPVPALAALSSGRDGLAALTVDDLIGDPASSVRRGMRTFELDYDAGALAIPDLMMQPRPAVDYAPLPQPADPCSLCPPEPVSPAAPPPIQEVIPSFPLAEIERAQQALVAHCEQMRYRIAVLDPPLFSARGESAEIAGIQSWRARFDSRYAALYFPWLLVRDPIAPPNQVVRAVPPCGHAMGIYATVDMNTGPHAAPANQAVEWGQDVVARVNASDQGVLNPLGINCFRVFPGRGLFLYGARTVSSETAWTFLNVRRLMCMIEKSIDYATQWAVFEPDNFQFRQLLRLSISSFLDRQWRRGALVGVTAADAFYVTCDASNNPPALSDAGQVLVEIGVAPVRPAEFVVFRIGKTQDSVGIIE